MGKGRLEAFSDGVFAIIITIMVLELHVPHGGTLADLAPLLPTFLSYVLSFCNVGIYWNNHHHMLHAARGVNGAVLWANLHLLFWLSLMPFATGWLGENGFTGISVALYGGVLFMGGVAYYLLERLLIAHEGPNSTLARAIGADRKGIASVVIYGLAIGLSFIQPAISMALYALVAVIWFVPDLRIARMLKE